MCILGVLRKGLYETAAAGCWSHCYALSLLIYPISRGLVNMMVLLVSLIVMPESLNGPLPLSRTTRRLFRECA